MMRYQHAALIVKVSQNGMLLVWKVLQCGTEVLQY